MIGKPPRDEYALLDHRVNIMSQQLEILVFHSSSSFESDLLSESDGGLSGSCTGSKFRVRVPLSDRIGLMADQMILLNKLLVSNGSSNLGFGSKVVECEIGQVSAKSHLDNQILLSQLEIAYGALVNSKVGCMTDQRDDASAIETKPNKLVFLNDLSTPSRKMISWSVGSRLSLEVESFLLVRLNSVDDCFSFEVQVDHLPQDVVGEGGEDAEASLSGQKLIKINENGVHGVLEGGGISASNWRFLVELLNSVYQWLFEESKGGPKLGSSQVSDPTYWLSGVISLIDFCHEGEQWLRFDEIYVVETFYTKGYQHIWLELEEVNVCGKFYEKLQYKLVFKGSDSIDGSITLSIELREFDGIAPPLKMWPVGHVDDFGRVVTFDFDIASGRQNFGWSGVCKEDRGFIRCLILSLPAQLDRLRQIQGFDGEVSYHDVLKTIAKVVAGVELLYCSSKSGGLSDSNDNRIVSFFDPEMVAINEFYEVGNYGHLKLKMKGGGGLYKNFDCEFKICTGSYGSWFDEAGSVFFEFRRNKEDSFPFQVDDSKVSTDQYGDYILIDHRDIYSFDDGEVVAFLLSLVMHLDFWLLQDQSKDSLVKDKDFNNWVDIIETFLVRCLPLINTNVKDA